MGKASEHERRGVVRRIGFRALAVLVGLAPLALTEAALRSFDIGRPDPTKDPFVGFHSVEPLFTPDATGSRYETSPSRYEFFRPDSFAAAKPPGTFRIFCLGGSTVQGRPYAIETSFTTWLKLSLQAADPSRDWEVVNCGGVSYASYRLAPILEELLDYEPDLFVLCIGHNEFLEERTYSHLKRLPRPVAEALRFASRLRTCELLARALRSFGRVSESNETPGPLLSTEVEALLDYQGGLERYHRDDTWRMDVIEHFEGNLRRMIAMAHNAGVPLLLINPICNLRDSAPFKSEHGPGLSPADERRWDELLAAAGERYETDLAGALELLIEAAEIDDRHAGLWFEIGKCHEALRSIDEAHQAYLRAKDEDICPLRILEPMSRIVVRVAHETGTPLIDVLELFTERSRLNIPGDDWLVDHVHPSIKGHQAIAEWLLEEMVRQGLVDAQPDRDERRDRLYAVQTASLGDLYFLQGQQRLRNLRGWAQGRGDLIRRANDRAATDSEP